MSKNTFTFTFHINKELISEDWVFTIHNRKLETSIYFILDDKDRIQPYPGGSLDDSMIKNLLKFLNKIDMKNALAEENTKDAG